MDPRLAASPQDRAGDPAPSTQNAPDEIFDRDAYRRRNIIERCIGWLKECRRVFSRFDKFAGSYLAFLKLAMLQRLLKFGFSDRA